MFVLEMNVFGNVRLADVLAALAKLKSPRAPLQANTRGQSVNKRKTFGQDHDGRAVSALREVYPIGR